MEFSKIKQAVIDFFLEIKHLLQRTVENEIRRRVVSTIYPYLMMIPSLVFWGVGGIASLISLMTIVILSGIISPDEVITNQLLMYYFMGAVVTGLVVGLIAKGIIRKRIDHQVGHMIDAKPFNFDFLFDKPEDKKEKEE